MRIVGYDFNGDTYCSGSCVLDALPTGEGQKYDGWKDLSGQSTEASLSELAYAFQIDREDERSFDSGDFPKVVLSTQLEGDEVCGGCGGEL